MDGRRADRFVRVRSGVRVGRVAVGRELVDTQTANLAAIIFAILPVPRSIAADVLSDSSHLLFYLLAAWLAAGAVRSGRLLADGRRRGG